jgi:hypothetical protein
MQKPLIPAGEGAVRELEKESIASQRAPNIRRGASAPPAISLGKDTGGAPEDAVRERSEKG